MKKTITLALAMTIALCSTIAQFNWEHTNGPEGGQALRLYYNDDYAFFSDKYYLYRTSDGLTWEQLDHLRSQPFAVNNDKILAIRNWSVALGYNEPTKWQISYDNGSTWSGINPPDGMEFTSYIAVCSHGLYAVDTQNNLLYRSQNDGLNWETVTTPVPVFPELFVFDDRLYTEVSDQLWRTDTNGENWIAVDVPVSSQENIKSYFVSGENIIVSAGDHTYYSNDDGQTWNSHATPLSNFDSFVEANGYIYAVGSINQFYRSGDYGNNWESLPPEDFNFNAPMYGMATAGGQALIGTIYKGILRWDEPSHQIKESNDGVFAAAIFSLGMGNGKIWAGTGTNVFSYDLQSDSWNQGSTLPLPEYYYHSVANGSNGLLCTTSDFGEYMFISTDYGVTWDTVIVGPGVLGFFDIRVIQVFENVIFAFSEFDGMLRSDDFGQTWTPWGLAGFGPKQIAAFNGQLFTSSYGDIYLSSDLGETWELHSTYEHGNWPNLFAAGDYLFASTGQNIGGHYRNNLYKSIDGINWEYAFDGLPNLSFNIGSNPDYLSDYFGYYQGIYYAYNRSAGFFASLDDCQTWLPVEYRTHHNATMADGYFYIGSTSGGILRSEMPNVYGELVDGTCYLDSNNDGVQNTGEEGIAGAMVGLHAPYSWYTYYAATTDTVGDYLLGIIPNPTDTLRAKIYNKYTESINPPAYSAETGGADKNFGIYLTPDINDLSVHGTYIGRPRPGFNFSMIVRYRNEGTTELYTKIALQLDPKLNFIEATPPPSEILGDSLVWEMGELELFSHEDLRIKVYLPDTIPLGEWVKNTCYAIPVGISDFTPDDNFFVMYDTTVGSYDPNDKKVEPADGLTEEEIAEGKEVFYTVRFQNTGTYLADRVRITDMLDTALYWPSLRLVGASHEITSFKLNPGGLLEIVFDNIYLPDSTSNEPGSHGFVTFAIQRNKNFHAFNPVRNFAAIYFDFNEPIFTNEVSFTIKEEPVSVFGQTSKKQRALKVYPNPTSNNFTVSANQMMPGNAKLTLFNQAGQTVLQIAVPDASQAIQVHAGELPEGLYIIRLANDQLVMTGKLVLQKAGN